MDRETVLALNAINRNFYAQVAAEWSDTRRSPWPGFARIAHCITAICQPESPLRVLDVGCGDGRFAAYLCEQLRNPLAYCGIDGSAALRQHARGRELGPQFRFEAVDFVDQPPSAAIPAEEFDLIAVLGVLHHVPSSQARRELVRTLGARLSAAGLLALTFWHLPDDPRFASRVVPWSAHNAQAATAIALEQLEPGDTLLRWGNGAAPPRYCHFPSAQEIDALLAESGLRCIDRFRADGRGDQLNEYVLLAR